MGVATDVSENYLDCLDVPAEIIYVSDTGDRLPVHRSFGLTDLFLLLFVSFFFSLTRRELVHVRTMRRDLFLFRFSNETKKFVRFAKRHLKESTICYLLRFDRELLILANPAGDEYLETFLSSDFIV